MVLDVQRPLDHFNNSFEHSMQKNSYRILSSVTFEHESMKTNNMANKRKYG